MKSWSRTSPNPGQNPSASAAEDESCDLATGVVELFKRWQLDPKAQSNLLGLEQTSGQLPSSRPADVAASLFESRDTRIRIGYLLGIHKGLRLLFPKDEDLQATWLKRENALLDGRRPLEIMTSEGLPGILRIARIINFQCAQ